MKSPLSLLLLILLTLFTRTDLRGSDPDSYRKVPVEVMKATYETVKTPYKYGLILVPEKGKMIDSPTIFREKERWYMSYVVFDGKGYETWLAVSDNLSQWQTLGRILSFADERWDATQRAGYLSLVDPVWGGSYRAASFNGNYWLSYIGGATAGYEAGKLGIGIAQSPTLTEAHEWDVLPAPVLSASDPDVRWFETDVLYKSSIIADSARLTGYPFVMYYNAKSLLRPNNKGIERIGMAVSEDLLHWKRLGDQPVIDNGAGISGDAQLTRMGELWVMFYFGCDWRTGAFDTFACSYDLIHWKRWEGANLISPSEDFDREYAHKPMVIKYKNIAYHFYNAVDKNGNRGIALATSEPIGKSTLHF